MAGESDMDGSSYLSSGSSFIGEEDSESCNDSSQSERGELNMPMLRKSKKKGRTYHSKKTSTSSKRQSQHYDDLAAYFEDSREHSTQWNVTFAANSSVTTSPLRGSAQLDTYVQTPAPGQVTTPVSTSGYTSVERISTLKRRISAIDRKQDEMINLQTQILAKLNDVITGSGGRKSTTGTRKSLKIPGSIRAAVRDGQDSGKDSGLKWTLRHEEGTMRLQSEVNKEMTAYIMSFVLSIYPSTADAVIKETPKPQGCHFKEVSWTEELKQKVSAAMTIDLVSSEHEEESKEETVFKVTHLPGRSEELNSFLSELDKKARASQSKLGKRQMAKRVPAAIPSIRNCPGWTLKPDFRRKQ